MTVYSHSRLNTFEQCKLRFKYQYIDKLEPPIKTTVEGFMGNMVHDALEKLYVDLKHGILAKKEDLLKYLETHWRENWTEEILIVRTQFTEEYYFDLAKKYFSGYYDKYYPFNQAEVLGTEILITIDLDKEGKYKMRGYVDRLDAKNGIYEVHDYKTAKNLPEQYYLDKDRQLALYTMAIKEKYGDVRDVKLIWHYLAHDKEMISERTDEQLEELRQKTIKVIQEIEATNDFPPQTSALCGWCGFKPICPKWKHEFLTEYKPVEKVESVKGTKLANEYAELKEKEKEVTEKLEELKEKILTFSKTECVDAIFGDNNRINVWRKECNKFPTKDDPDYENFIDMVQKLGLWNEFSKVDSFKLEKAFEEGEFHNEIKSILEKFAKKQSLERLYMSKK